MDRKAERKVTPGYARKTLAFGLTSAAALLAVSMGALFGLGVFTFHYAEGFSYMSSDPRACVNCHIMRSQFVSWQRSSHHAVAACIDCHLPHHGLRKWIAKADAGYRHSKAFTLQNFREPIVMIARSRAILQRNCLECHAELTHELAAGRADAVECVHCHRSAGHGPRLALGGPERSDERIEDLHD